METTMYYYSATGNSLVLAREIARGLGGAKLLPISNYRKAPFKPETERIGIVFPIIAWGPPRTVDEFIANLDPTGLRYVFAIASCGGTAAGALPRMRRALRAKGGELHAGFILRSQGYLEVAPEGRQAKMIALVQRLSGRPFPREEEGLPAIIEAAKTERRSRPERNALPGAIVGNFLHDKATPQFARMDANFKVAPTCDGCNICARVCPRENIALEKGRPTWRHDCDFCGACSTWCPEGAIAFDGGIAPAKRHNEAVALSDFYLR